MPNYITDHIVEVNGLIRIALAAVVILGFPMTEEQKTAILVVANLLLTLVSRATLVPKTPSVDASPAAIQTPQPPA